MDSHFYKIIIIDYYNRYSNEYFKNAKKLNSLATVTPNNSQIIFAVFY